MAGAQPVAGMLGLTFEVAGVPQVARVLGIAMHRVRNLQPVWNDIADDFVKGEKKVFSQEGSVPGWEQWAPVNEEYAKLKAAQGYGTKILRRTGVLERSLTNRADRNFFYQAGPLRMEIGTTVPYARYHQEGTKKMKKREPIRVADTQRRHWVQLIQKFVIESGQFERVSEYDYSFGKRGLSRLRPQAGTI